MTVFMSASDASGGVARDGCANGRRWEYDMGAKGSRAAEVGEC